MRLDHQTLPTHTADGLKLDENRRLPAHEERRLRELFKRNYSQQSSRFGRRKRNQEMTHLSQVLQNTGSLMERLKSLVASHPRPKPITTTKEVCKRCDGAGSIRQDLPPDHPRFGRALVCRKCRDPWLEYRNRLESIWPVPTNTLALARYMIDERHEQISHLADVIEEIVREWPQGVMVVLDGRYGTTKTHALSVIYNQAWAQKKGAVYLSSAQQLQQAFTMFQSREIEIKASLNSALQMGDGVTGQEAAEQQKRLRIDRQRLTAELLQVPWLLIDEAHRYSRKGGNGWIEQHMANLIDEKLASGTSVVLAGNGLGDGRQLLDGQVFRAGPISNRLHPSILDRASSKDCKWIDLNEVPSGRQYYGRNAGKWFNKRK